MTKTSDKFSQNGVHNQNGSGAVLMAQMSDEELNEEPDFEAEDRAKEEEQAADGMTYGMVRFRLAQDNLEQAAKLPEPTVLYPNLVIENELIILFADTGIGKTVYATQIGVHIAAQKTVLYVDLELNDRQFLKRYRGTDGSIFQFPSRFYRADFAPRFSVPKGISYEQHFIQSLEQVIEAVGAEVVIIDNLTKLVAGDTDSAKTAIPILEHLSRLKFDGGLTIIVLEHNKKTDAFRPISLNDLQGSKMKSNFADAVFSIGRSATQKNQRYIKQLKVRSAELVYDTENVPTYEITTEEGHLHFKFIGYSNELEHIKQRTGDDKDDTGRERYEQIKQARDAGYKGNSLAEYLGWTKGYISQIEKKYGSKSDDD